MILPALLLRPSTFSCADPSVTLRLLARMFLRQRSNSDVHEGGASVPVLRLLLRTVPVAAAVLLLLASAAGAGSLDIPVSGRGIGFGNSRNFQGLRFNFQDRLIQFYYLADLLQPAADFSLDYTFPKLGHDDLSAHNVSCVKRDA